MKLLLDSRKLILAISEKIDFVIHEDMEKWRIGEYSYYMDNNYSVEEVLDVPIFVVPDKYFYIDEEFILNPNWSNAPDEIKELNKRIDAILLEKAESEIEIDERLSKIELGLA